MADRQVLSTFLVWLCNNAGTRVAVLKQLEFLQYTLKNYDEQDSPAVAIVTFPAVVDNIEFDYNTIEEDGWLEIWRSPDDGQGKRLEGDTVWLIVEKSRTLSGDGSSMITIRAYAAARVANWPIAAYAAGASQVDQTDNADNIIKISAAQNIGASATDTDRDLSSLIDFESSASAAASESKQFSRRKLGTVYTELCQSSANDGTRLFWDIILKSPEDLTNRKLELRTFTGTRRADHSASSPNPVIFSSKRGNLTDVVLIESWDGVVNFGYAGGQGQEGNREIQSASDATRIAESPWGRIKEGWRDARHVSASAGVLDEAKSLVRAGRPRVSLTGRAINTPSNRFGVEWYQGDIVVAEEFGQRFDSQVTPVTVTYRAGQETVDAVLRSE